MPRKVFKESEEEETTGLFDFEDDEKKEIPKEDSPSDNEEKLEDDEDEDEDAASDSDDAPEAVSFHSGEETMLAQMREMLQTIKDDKLKKKNKRKKVEELYTAQKKQRLAYLAKRRLPDDVVDALKTPTPAKTKKHESESETESEIPIPANEEDEVVINPRLLEGGAEFLPLDTSVPHARTLNDVKKVERSSKTALLDFKHKALYGGRIPRQSTKMTIAQQKKRQVSKLPMVPTR